MKLVNEQGNDLSVEAITCLYAGTAMIGGVELIFNLLDRLYTENGWKGTIFQQKRRDLNAAAQQFRTGMQLLSRSFDGLREKIWSRVPGQEMKRYDALQWAAGEAVKLQLIAATRADMDAEKHAKMQKALMNFKEDPEYPIDLPELLKYFSIDFKNE